MNTSPSAPGNQDPVLDREDLMLRLMDDENLARLIVASALTDIPNQLTKLTDAISSRDLESVGVTAHTMRGAAASSSASELARISETMEEAALAGDWLQVEALSTKVREAFERLERETEKIGWS